MIAIIAACSKNNVIGINGKIPWKLPEDLHHFKTLTNGNLLIMGRKTFESIGVPLPERFTIVISTTKIFDSENCKTVSSFEKALEMAKKITSAKNADKWPFYQKDIFVCGGQKVYEEAIHSAEKIYLTKIDSYFEGDAFFPEIDKYQFCETARENRKNQDYSFSFLEYQRILQN